MISYKRLYKLLIDKDLKKTDLKTLIGISSSTLAKLNKNEYVALEVIDKMCATLDCQPEDIIEYVPDENSNKTIDK